MLKKFHFKKNILSAKDIVNLNNKLDTVINKLNLLEKICRGNVDIINRLIQNNISIAELHKKTFLKFKGINTGKKVVLIATGPSAAKYVPLDNAIHIGVNRAYKLNKAKLDYIFIQDYSGKTPEYIGEIDKYLPDECIKFYGITSEYSTDPIRVIPEFHALEANAYRYRTDWENYPGFKPSFVFDLSSKPLGCFGSVVFPALQFALWTNAKEIYLVGCDCTQSGYAYNTQEKNFLIPNLIIEAYKKFKVFRDIYYPSTKIYSINPVALKGLFEDIYM